MSRARRGHALLGLLLLVGLAASALCALVLLVATRPPGPQWLVGSLLLTGASALAPGRRDRTALLQVLLFATAAPALLLALWVLLTPGPHGAALGAGPLLALLAGLCARGAWRELAGPAGLPDVLRARVPARETLERDGLQLHTQVVAQPGGTHELRVTVQSCVDQERRLRLRLRSATPQRLEHPPEVEARLAAAEVGLLRVPLRVPPGPADPGPLWLQLHVSGPAGRRVRRANVAVEGAPPALARLFAGSGALPWRARSRVRIPRAHGTAAPALPPAAPGA